MTQQEFTEQLAELLNNSPEGSCFVVVSGGSDLEETMVNIAGRRGELSQMMKHAISVDKYLPKLLPNAINSEDSKEAKGVKLTIECDDILEILKQLKD